MRSQPWLRIFFPPQQERKVLLRQGPVARVFSPGVLRRQRPLVRQVLKKNCEIGVGFSFAALSVFRLRRAEAVSALWIPHWHSEPFESQGARAAKGWT